ncbi:MAG: zinc-ribbon domain-containing protein [Archangium sp.]
MRIVCQKCSAAYAIDDKFVTPKGVRAQCPRCRHLQLVKKDDAPAPAAAANAPSPFLFDMGAPPAPAAAPAAPPPSSSGSGLHFGQTKPAQGGAAAPNPFDFSPPTNPGAPAPFDFSAPPTSPSNPAPPPPSFPVSKAPPPPPPAAAEPSPFDFSGVGGGGASNPFDFGSPPPGAPGGAAPNPFGGDLDLGMPLPPPPPPSSARSAPPPPPPPSAPAAPAQVTGVKCRTCGKEMTDPFDQALGVCDDCRNKAAEPVSAPPPMAAAATASAAAEKSASKAPAFPSAHTPITTAADARGGVQTAMRDAGGGGEGKGRVVLMLVGALVVIAIAAFLVIKKPWVSKPPPLVVKGNTGATRPVEQIVQQWRNKYLDLEKGSGPQLIDEGEAQLQKDTTSAYADAEESFEQALVLDPSSDRALAGWVLALAFGKPGKIDEPTANAAESMLTAAEQRGGDARIFVAHAHFLIARGGNPNDIKVLAERGLSSKSNEEKALAHLAIGQTILNKSPEQAADNFKQALAIDPKLKRAYFFQSQLSAIQGNYKEATRALERRLELDADQWEAAEELARLLIDVGELPKAKKVLEAARTAAPKSGRPRIGLAVLAYQHQNDFAGATTELQAIIDDAEIARGEKADALIHLAAIQRIQGDADKANDTIDRALGLNADSVPAKLQKLLISIDKGVASAARLELDGLKGKLGDKYLEQTLEGRVLILETRLDDAIQTLGAVSEADPRRVDATLLAGAAAAKARKSGKAWEYCLKKGLRLDPASRPVPALTPMYVRPADLLKAAVGTYTALVPDADEDPSPSLCEGMVAWYSEDYTTADKFFARVTSIDPRNSEGFAFRSLIAARKKDLGGAQRYAAKAVEGGKGNALAWYSQSNAFAAANKTDPAKSSAQQAQKLGPQLLGPRVIVGDAEATQKNASEAKRLLTSVLLADPLYRDAKRVLFKHQL